MIKVVSFDIGGTLIKEEGDYGYSINDLALLVDKDKKLVKKCYKDIFQKEKGSFDELVNKFADAIDYKRNDKLDNFFLKKFNDSSSITDEARNAIELVHNLGYRIILFSNSCCLIKNTIPKEILKLIEHVYYSFDLGYTKSDKEAYKTIVDDLNVKPDEILHVGDIYSSDYLSPKENGFNALFYGETEENVDKITNLLDIVNYLDKKNQ